MLLLIEFTNGIASLIINESDLGEINDLIENFTGSAIELINAIEENFDARAVVPYIITTNIKFEQ